VAIIHGETTTGLLNPISVLGEITALYNKALIVDAMSTFGAYDIDMKKLNISYLISSSNKCIEGIPGFSYVLAKRSELEKCKGRSRSLSLDLFDQWTGLNSNGQFRFTPPVQALLAFHTALNLLDKEGGVDARAIRYRENNKLLVNEMKKAGFEIYLPDEIRSYIITSFIYPTHPNFSFEMFYSKLNEKGFVIYPGKLSKVDCFRIGNIGQLFPDDIQMLVDAIADVLRELKIDLRVK
jgi:2-aminoethylphosphonate-pyruvate transaminase